MSELAREEETTKFDVEIHAPENVLKIAYSGLRLLSDRKMNFDHHLCEKMIGCREVPWERPLRPEHVQYLISTMMRGTFHPEWVRFIICEFEGVDWRMNGQHTGMARLEMPKIWKEAGQVAVMTYAADNIEAMRELYASIDRGAPRTRKNILNSYLVDTEQFEGIAPTLISLLGTGMAFWLWEGTHELRKHDADEAAWLMQHTHKTIISSVAAFCLVEPRITYQAVFMRRRSVIAAMLETFSKVYQPSVDFWMPVRTGLGFDTQDDPRLRLRTLLQEARISITKNAVVRQKRLDEESLYRICIAAFNKWRKGETAKVLLTTKERQRAK